MTLAGVERKNSESQAGDECQGSQPAEQQAMIYLGPEGDDQKDCSEHRYDNRHQSAGVEQPGLFGNDIFGRSVQIVRMLISYG